MLNRIIAFSIRNKLIVGLLTLFLIFFGAYEVTKLPIDAVPDITDNQVQVITVAPALGAPDVERLITFPIEQACMNIPGLKKIRSFSRFGLSVVTIVFNDNIDVYWARQQVTERLQRAQEQIPKGFGIPSLAPVTTGLGEIYQYCIRPKPGYESKYTSMELRTIQDWIIRRQLLSVKGVADVASFGGHLKQYEIAVNPSKLMANGVTMADLFAALEKNNQNTGGAYIEKDPTVLFIRSEGLVGSIDDIGNIVVKTLSDGSPLLVRNVAEVKIGSAIRYGAMTFNGTEEVAGAVVMMLKGANSSEVIANVKERIREIEKTLPEGVQIDAFLDRTKMVNNSIHTVTKNLLEGALIVVFVLVLFLGNLRAGLLVASIIPLSMLFAVIMMNLFGVSGNLMSLGALDFGLIVDGAVIIVEAVMHRLSSNRQFGAVTRLKQHEMDEEVKGSATRMMNAAVFGQIIILIVYLPIFTLEGIEGKMFLPMAQTVAFALLGAFLLSLTYVPMMSTLVISKKIHHSKNFSDRLLERMEGLYVGTLEKVMKIPRLVVLASFAAFAVSIVVLLQLGGEFIPSLPEGDFAVETRVLTGSSLNTSMKAVSDGSRILLEKFPEVEKVVGKTGSSEIPTDPMPLEASDMMVILKPKKEWTSAESYDELMEKMSRELEAVPGVFFGFQYPVAMRFNELMTGARQDVVCKIFGEDLDTLAAYANRIGEISASLEGSKDVYIEAVTGMPQVVIDYNRSAIAQYGLNISEINDVINTAFAGRSSGLVFEGEKRFDLVIRLSSENRKDLQDIRNLLIPTPGGALVPLHTLATIDRIDGPNQIQREDAHRRIIVGFNVRGRDIQTVVHELQDKIEASVKFPPGYHITYGGAFENLEAARKRLLIAVPVSLLLIFVMLYFAFNSVKQGLLIYSAIPLSAIGGILALALRGMPFSISAGVGFIALFGVSVLNGIVLVAEFNRLKAEGMNDIRQIIMKGSRSRLRPVMMTALVASLGFLPMALSTGEGAEVQRPLATVVIGGLLVATFLTLIVLPSLYVFFEKKSASGTIAAAGMVIFLLSCCPSTCDAQQPITLQAALDTALKNNLSVRNEQLYADYMEKVKGTGYNLPQTNVSLGYGQINSIYNDNAIGVQQSLRFPTVYTRQKNVLNEEWKSSLIAVSLRQREVKKKVRETFCELLYLQKKIELLERSDSIFAGFLQSAELRLNKGESNAMEQSMAVVQRGQIGNQLREARNDQEIASIRFRLLLNSAVYYTPADPDYRMDEPMMADTSVVREHPAVKLLQQQERISLAKWRLEKTKFTPDLIASYNNMSMKGTGADDVYYTSSSRFQSFQVGIGIPLFFGAQSAHSKAQEAGWHWSKANYQQGVQELQANYRHSLLNYQKQKETVAYFEKTALKNAAVVLRTADAQFRNGSINYLEWVILMNQAIAIESEYLDAVRKLNTSAIELNYYSENN